MLTILVAALMSLPVYPLNPTEQDTLELVNLHITAGVDGPNGVMSLGPEMSLRYEILMFHPLVFRPGIELQTGSVTNPSFPDGRLTALTLSGELLAYRGTDRLTGYLGTGITYSNFYFTPEASSADSLFDNYGVTNVHVKKTVGYRITMGIRYHRVYSAEFGITEVRPLFSYQAEISSSQYSEYSRKSRMSNVRFTLGYLIPFRIF